MELYSRWLKGDMIIYPGGSGGGNEFFVDANFGDDTWAGTSFERPFKTLAVALAASHADIAAGSKGWAARNRIYFKGDQTLDAEGETLVLLAQKTDIIGVGSTSSFMQPTLVGNHVPISATGIGVRFFNMRFRCPAAGGTMFTLNATQRGIEFHGCTFDATNTAAATSAIIATAVWFLKIRNCEFIGPFSGPVISILIGNAQGLHITDNYIEGAAQGVLFATGVTYHPTRILVAGNTIITGTECIVDTDETVVEIVNNTLTTLQAKGVSGVGAVVANEFLAAGNKITASDLANADWPVLGTV